MKKPTIEKIRLFLSSLGLTDTLLPHQTEDGTCVEIREISSFYVDGELLCKPESALLAIETALNSKPERIRDYDGIIWRFKVPMYGYVSLEERQNNNFLRLDNGI